MYETNDFSNTKIKDCTGNVCVKEIIEFKRNNLNVLRISAIRDDEELLCWEVPKSSQEEPFLRTANSGERKTFRWPLYAYADGNLGVKITNFADARNIV